MSDKSSRRSFLKKSLVTTSSAAVLGTGFVNLSAMPVAAAASTPSETYDSMDDHTELYGSTYISTGISNEVGWFGAQWDSIEGGYRHYFRSNTGCASERDDTTTVINAITEQGTGLDWSSGFQDINADMHQTSCGVTPLPAGSSGETGLNWDDAALELVKSVVSGIVPVVGDFDSAASIVSALLGTSSYQKYNFDFNDHYDHDSYGGSCDHHREFEPVTDGTSQGSLEVKSYCRSINCTPRLTTYITLGIDGTNPPPDYDLNPSSTEVRSMDFKKTDKGTHMFTGDEGNRFEYIPTGQIRARGRQLGWSEAEIEEKLDQNQPIYFLHTSPITSVDTGSRKVYDDENWLN